MEEKERQRILRKIQKQWDLPSLVSDLRQEKWRKTEPHRIDRMRWIGSYDLITSMAQDAFSEQEWREAAADGFEGELVDDYLSALGDALIEATGKELRREHIYTTLEEGDVFIGQYEDMAAADLRHMGFEIEN
jgi:hypothetical protein